MAQSAPNQQPDEYYRANARAYLRSLISGVKPDIRPEFGRYERALRMVESAFAEIKPGEHAKMLPRSIKTIGNIRANKELKFHALLTEQGEEQASTVQGIEYGAGTPILPEEVQLPPVLSKDACQWLDNYKEYSRKASPEGFEDYHEDCGLFNLAAVSARRVRVPVGNGEHTPLSVALVGKPGTYAKSTTAGVAVNVLRAADLGWLLGSDETTPQKLLMDMAGAHIDKKYSLWDQARKEQYKERKSMAAQVAWYCDEFGELVKSINKATGPMADLKKLILKFDNCPSVYSTSTITRGREEIANPFLSFLGPMTPASIKKSAQSQSEEWGDGFWSRFVFSCAPDDDGIDAPFDYEYPVPPALSEPLLEYHERLGVPEIEIEEILDKKGDQVIDYVINQIKPLPETIIDHKPIAEYWIRYRSALKKLLKDVPEDLKASYIRLPTRALRVAALFASFEGLDHMELKHWAKAQEITERWRKSLHEFYRQVNTSEVQSTLTKTIEDKILAYVEQNQNCLDDKDKIPTARNLGRNMHVAAGLIKTVLIDMEQIHMLGKIVRGKTTYYTPFCEDDG